MRPLELRLRNFRSYFGDGARFDFRDRRLIGVVGPIGSGKSSLLDAIAFALYGKTPTSGSNRKSLIHQRSNDMAVKFRFAVGDDVWEVVRVLRRKGAAQHALYRLSSDEAATGFETGEDDAAAPEIVERVVLDGPVNERIVELLGLDYDAFGRSVMLAQNRFSEFLSAGPTQRDLVLKGVFGHDRIDDMRARAKQLAAEAQAELDQLTVRTERLDSVSARLTETSLAHAEATKRLATLEVALPTVSELEAAIATAAETAKTAQKRLDDLTAAGDGLPPEAQTAALLDAAHGAAAHRLELAEALEQRGEELAAADAALAALSESGEDVLIEKASALLTHQTMQHKELGHADKAVAELAANLDQARARSKELEVGTVTAADAEKSAAAVVTAAAGVVARARQAVTQAERADMADTLREALTSGDSCPVCQQQVDVVPATGGGSLVADIAAALEHALEHQSIAEREHTDAVAEVSRIGQSLESQAATVEEASVRHATMVADADRRRKDLDNVFAELDALLGKGDHTALLTARRNRKAELVSDAQKRKQELERVRQTHEQAVRDAQTVDRQMSTLVAQLASVGGRLGEDVSPDRNHPDDVAEALDRLRMLWATTVGDLQQVIAGAAQEQAASVQQHRDLLESLDVERSLPETVASVTTTIEHLHKDIAKDKKELEAAESLLADKAARERDTEVYARLVDDLKDSQFIRFLLDEERTRLAALGSEHFLRLSSGRYAFTEDGEFSIVDLTSADAVRKAASLSGGETFLASLALALALAEMVARTGGRLDAFLLDEGFGSLDAEHLDLAMEGIEALVTDNRDRLVVVVSHVPELRHRIDDRIQLDRDPLTGDTKILRA